MQLASGLSFALFTSNRCFRISAAQGVYGRPPGMLPPASKNVATGGPVGSNGKRSVGGSSCTPPLPPANAALVSPAAAPAPAGAAAAAGAGAAAPAAGAPCAPGPPWPCRPRPPRPSLGGPLLA